MNTVETFFRKYNSSAHREAPSGGVGSGMNCTAGLYPSLVIILILAIYGVYLCNNILPQLNGLEDTDADVFYTPSEGELIGVLVAFHVLLGMLLLCFTLGQANPNGTPLSPHAIFVRL